MKTTVILKTILSVLFFIFTFNVVNADSLNVDNKNMIKKQLNNFFKEAAKELKFEKPIEAVAIITVDENGNHYLDTVESEDESIIEFVRSKVSDLKFAPSDIGTYRVTYKYKK
jgi:hypothetical protein